MNNPNVDREVAGRRRLCAVNVKLTIRLPIAAGLLGSAGSILAGLLQVAGAVVTLGGSNRFGHRARSSRMSPGCLRGKIGTNEGGLSQSPPFSLILLDRFWTRVLDSQAAREAGRDRRFMERAG